MALKKLSLLEEIVVRNHQTTQHKVQYIAASLIINEDIFRMESMVCHLSQWSYASSQDR